MDTFTQYEPLTITIVEGPAGAGKTTLIEQVPNVHRIKGIRLPRQASMNPTEMAAMSIWNDVAKITGAYRLARAAGSGPIVIDRLAISQYVYGTLRGDLSLLPPSGSTIARLFQDVGRMFFDRTGWHPGEPLIQVVFVLPTEREVIQRRERVYPRLFPYAVNRELELYTKAYDHLYNTATANIHVSRATNADAITQFHAALL